MGVKTALFGDSCAFGALGEAPNGRLSPTPAEVMNAAQQSYDFAYDHSRGGANWQAFFSQDQATRESVGLPNGVTFAQFVTQHADLGAVMFCLGGLDMDNLPFLSQSIRQAAGICTLASKAFAFVGVANINATSSYAHTPINADPNDQTFWGSFNLERVCKIAAADEMIRQTCLHNGYVYVDMRNRLPKVLPSDWGLLTGDIIHPTQAYSQELWRMVALQGIGGQPW